MRHVHGAIMPDSLAGCHTIFETSASRHASVCLRPTSRTNIEESYSTDVQATQRRSKVNLVKAEIQRRVSAPARCSKVTDLDVAAATIARRSFNAPKDSLKSITSAEKIQIDRTTDYVDMDVTKNLGLQGLLKLNENTQVRRASSSAIMGKRRCQGYHDLINMKPDNQLSAERSILLSKDRMNPDALDTSGVFCAPADCAHLIDSAPESRVLSFCDNNLSYVNMSCADDEENHKESFVVTLRSKSPDLIVVKKCSPESNVDSGSSSCESVFAYTSKVNSSSTDSGTGTSDELYFSCRTHLSSQTENGQGSLKRNNVDVITKMQEFVALIPFKKYFNSSAFRKSSVSMPNIHDATQKNVQKGNTLPSNCHETNKMGPHTRINMSWANESFNEALDNPIKIPSLVTSTITGEPSFKNRSTEVKNMGNITDFFTTSVNSCPDKYSRNFTEIRTDMPSTSDSKSKFSSVSINNAEEVLASKKYRKSNKESDIPIKRLEIKREPSKTIDQKNSLRTIENSVSTGDIPMKIGATDSKSGIFSVKDLISEQRHESERTRSASVFRRNSSSETVTLDDPVRRFLRFSSSSNSSNSIRNSTGRNSSSNAITTRPHSMLNQTPRLDRNEEPLSLSSNTSCSPILHHSCGALATTKTSLWIPENHFDGAPSQSHQSYSNVFVDTVLERTSSTPLLEWPASPLISPACVSALSGLQRSHDKFSHLHDSDDLSSDVVPDRPQLLQYLFRSKSLAFHSHPLLPLLHRLVLLEFTLLHAPLEIKLVLPPHPSSLSALLALYCEKRPQACAFVAAVLPRGLVSPGQREGRTTTGFPEETSLPTLHRVMLEVVASTHYSVVDMMAELGMNDILAQNNSESDQTSSSLLQSAQNASLCHRRSFTTPHSAKTGHEKYSNYRTKSTERPSTGINERRSSNKVFYQKLPSFV